MTSYSPSIRTMTDGDVISLYKWRIDSWNLGKKASFALADPREVLKTTLPTGRIMPTTSLPEELLPNDVLYVNAGPNVWGTVVPLIYGKMQQAQAYLVDRDTKTFLVCSNGFQRLTRVTLGGTDTIYTTIDPGAGTFTLDDYDEEQGGEVRVDVVGALSNPADVIEDLLLQVGVSSADLLTPASSTDEEGTGFGPYGARTKLIRGIVRGGADDGLELPLYAVGLRLQSVDLFRTIDNIAAVAGLLFYVNSDGLYTLIRWDAVQAESFPRCAYEDGSLLSLEETATSQDTFTAVQVRYAEVDGEWQSVVKYSDDIRRARGLPEHLALTWDTPLSNRSDAILLASRTLAMRGPPLRTYKAIVSRRFLASQPGGGVWLHWAAVGVDSPYEILGISYTPGAPTVELELGDWRGQSDKPGFWVGDSETAPSYYGGSPVNVWEEDSAGWNDEELRYAQTNIGYWTDDQGFADATQTEESRNKSCWI